MRIIKKCLAVIFYLFLVVLLLGFDIRKLVNIRQLLMVLFGAVILYLPNMHRYQRIYMDWELFGRAGLLASMIQTFILLFILLSENRSPDGILYYVALECRPLLYGFCLWMILGDDFLAEKDSAGKGEGQSSPQDIGKNLPELTMEQCAERLRELGLSPREIEVALHVSKGMSNAQIAGELFISETTVKKHMSNIFAKLKIGHREQIRAVIQKGIKDND